MKQALAIAALILAACAPVDRGLLVRSGVEIHAAELPVFISCKLDDCSPVHKAINWWNKQTDVEAFRISDDFYSIAIVEEDDLPWPQLGVARLRYAPDGSITKATVVLQVGEWHDAALRHELGHTLGLDDDPNSVDLRSVMSGRWVRGYRVTPYDRATVRRLSRGSDVTQ